MNLDLSEFVGTLCIGGGVILVAVIFLRVYCVTELSHILEGIDGRLLGNPFLLAIAAFTLGMIAEDVSNNYVDTDGHFFQRKLNFPQESDLRYRVFFGSAPLSSKAVQGKVKPQPVNWGRLAQNYARLNLIDTDNPQFGKYVHPADRQRVEASSKTCPTSAKDDPRFGARVQSAILQGRQIVFSECPNGTRDVREDLEGLTNGIYYHAKNVSYREANYFSELSLIQNRIDFARSLAILAVVFVGLGILAFLVRGAVLLARLREKPKRGEPSNPAVLGVPAASRVRATRRTLENTTLSTVYLMALAGVVYMASQRAYASEEMEFNRRALGYYASVKQEAAMAEADAARPNAER